MFLLDWYKQWLDIRAEYRQIDTVLSKEVKQEELVCQSCETLKQQLEIANYEKQKLLDRILEKPELPKETEPPKITRPHSIPWAARRQILEQEDREKARAMRNAATPDSSHVTLDVSDLEKELGVAQQAREAESAK